MSKTKPLYPRKYRRCRRGAPPCRHADRRLQWRFRFIFGPAPTKDSWGDNAWRVDGLLTQTPDRNRCIGECQNQQGTTVDPELVPMPCYVAPFRGRASAEVPCELSALGLDEREWEIVVRRLLLARESLQGDMTQALAS